MTVTNSNAFEDCSSAFDVPSSEINNNGQNTTLLAKRCLFGKSDEEETKKLAENEIASQKKYVLERYNINIETIDSMFAGTKSLEKLVIMKHPKKKSGPGLRGVLKPYNRQLKITDCFKPHKNLSSNKKKE